MCFQSKFSIRTGENQCQFLVPSDAPRLEDYLGFARNWARMTAKISALPSLAAGMATAARAAGAATGPIRPPGCGRPAIRRCHDGEEFAQPGAAAFRAVWLRAIINQLLRLLATFFTRVFVERHIDFSQYYQRSLGRFMISLSRTACRTPSGLVSMAAICAAGLGRSGAVGCGSVIIGNPPSVPTV